MESTLTHTLKLTLEAALVSALGIPLVSTWDVWLQLEVSKMTISFVPNSALMAIATEPANLNPGIGSCQLDFQAG